MSRWHRDIAAVREAVLDLLRAFRMTTVFGNPGSTELPLFLDFPADFRWPVPSCPTSTSWRSPPATA